MLRYIKIIIIMERVFNHEFVIFEFEVLRHVSLLLRLREWGLRTSFSFCFKKASLTFLLPPRTFIQSPSPPRSESLPSLSASASLSVAKASIKRICSSKNSVFSRRSIEEYVSTSNSDIRSEAVCSDSLEEGESERVGTFCCLLLVPVPLRLRLRRDSRVRAIRIIIDIALVLSLDKDVYAYNSLGLHLTTEHELHADRNDTRS